METIGQRFKKLSMGMRRQKIMKMESVKELQRKERAGKLMWLKELREKGIRFRTFHILPTNTHLWENEKGKVVVASRYFPQTSTIHMQFSFCSVKNKFDRKEGQFIAAERLMESPIDKKLSGNTIELIKETILEEGAKRNISWMLNLTKENIR